MNKRGISSIVATVLIILITVVAVAIIWTIVLPMIRNASFQENTASLSIDITEGYTVYDAQRNLLAVQVKRGTDDANLLGIQFIFFMNGNSKIEERYGVPGFNQENTYYFNFSDGKPDSIKIAPIYYNRKVGEIVSQADSIPLGDLSSFDTKTANEIYYVDNCREINSSGIYVLNKSLNSFGGDCIDINASNIILDGRGFSITGNYSGGNGIGFYGANVAVTIENFSQITGYNYGIMDSGSNGAIMNIESDANYNAGVFISGSNNLLTNIIAKSNSENIKVFGRNNVLTNIVTDSDPTVSTGIGNSLYGIEISGRNNSLNNIRVSNSNYGIYLGSNNYLTNSVADSCGEGVVLISNNIVANASSTNSGDFGFRISRGSNNNLLNITSNGNAYGIYIENGANNTFTNINVSRNYWDGIYLTGSNNATFSNINAEYNLGYCGIAIDSSINNYFDNVNAKSNSVGGICLTSSNDNTFSNINASGRGDIYGNGNSDSGYGFYIYSSSNNFFTGITADSNSYGILLYSSSNNAITNMIANYNIVYGIYLTSSSNNILTNITASFSNNSVVCSYDMGYCSGFYFYSSSNNILTNITANSNDYGISLSWSFNNTVDNSKINLNDYGIFISNFNIEGASSNDFSNNNVCSNSVDFYCDDSAGISIFSQNKCSSNSNCAVLVCSAC